MTSKNYNNIITDLNERINKHIDIPSNKNTSDSKNVSKTTKSVIMYYIYKYIYFIIIPIVSITIAFIIKPSFCYKETKNEQNEIIKSLDYSRVILLGLFTGLSICIAINFYKNKN